MDRSVYSCFIKQLHKPGKVPQTLGNRQYYMHLIFLPVKMTWTLQSFVMNSFMTFLFQNLFPKLLSFKKIFDVFFFFVTWMTELYQFLIYKIHHAVKGFHWVFIKTPLTWFYCMLSITEGEDVVVLSDGGCRLSCWNWSSLRRIRL